MAIAIKMFKMKTLFCDIFYNRNTSYHTVCLFEWKIVPIKKNNDSIKMIHCISERFGIVVAIGTIGNIIFIG